MFIRTPDLHRAKSDQHIRLMIPVSIYERNYNGHLVGVRPYNDTHVLHTSAGHLYNNDPARHIFSDKMVWR